jgi:hypothetical protein
MVQIGSNSTVPWTGNAGDILERRMEEMASKEITDSKLAPDRRKDTVDKLARLLKSKWNITVSTKGRQELANVLQ